MKKRPIWMICLAAAFFVSIVLIRKIDDMEFHGLRVMSEERLNKLTEGLTKVDDPQNVEELIRLDDKRVPYVRNDNTFYVSQSIQGKAYAGTFRAQGDNCRIYLQEDAVLEDKQTVLAQGRQFTLWFVTGESYTTAQLIFTGLPVVCISTEDGALTQSYERGSLVVHNPDDDDVITMSVKKSDLEARVNPDSGTISFKLYKNDYAEERDLSLLGLGKRTSWKLYPVCEDDKTSVGEMLASYVWNSVCGNQDLQRGMEYAELIVDGEYMGLYYLAPKIGKGFLKLEDADRAYDMEDLAEDGTKLYTVIGDQDTPENRMALEQYESLWEEGNTDFSQIDADNYINYHIYLQAACAVQNSMKAYCVIAREDNGTYQFSKMPQRSKFVFGQYPARIGWQSLFATENVMEDAEYAMVAEQTEGMAAATAGRWQDLRKEVLSTDSLLKTAHLCEQRLADSGYIVREEEPEAYAAACDALHTMIAGRMEHLDGYYNDGVR